MTYTSQGERAACVTRAEGAVSSATDLR
jgi:hypothetical protein